MLADKSEWHMIGAPVFDNLPALIIVTFPVTLSTTIYFLTRKYEGLKSALKTITY